MKDVHLFMLAALAFAFLAGMSVGEPDRPFLVDPPTEIVELPVESSIDDEGEPVPASSPEIPIQQVIVGPIQFCPSPMPAGPRVNPIEEV
jgi:hypothetical protein